VLVVRNTLRQPVEIYGYVGSSKTVLGYASPGGARIPVIGLAREELGVVFAELDGRRVSPRQGEMGSVTVEKRCEADVRAP
jgi:hypothetical protein